MNKTIYKQIPLLMIVLIDSMGMGILVPILSIAFMSPHSPLVTLGTSAAMRQLDFSAVISVFMLSWFFGAAILSDYSDIRGRKHCLSICLIGAALGYALSALAIGTHHLWMLIVGRVIAGITAGSQSIAQAVIVDESSQETLNKHIGFIILASCLGFVLGPLLGGLLSNPKIPHATLATPMWVATALAAFNLILLYFFFKETRPPKKSTALRLSRAILLFKEALSHPRIRSLSLIYIVFVYGWSNYYSFISLYLIHSYHYTTLTITLFSVVLGLGFCLGSGYLNDKLAQWGCEKMVVTNLLITAALCLIGPLLSSEITIWVSAFFIGTLVAAIYAHITTLFSLAVSEDEQGWVMGINGSMMALSFGVSTFLGGMISGHHPILPLYLSGFGLLLASLLAYQWILKKS